MPYCSIFYAINFVEFYFLFLIFYKLFFINNSQRTSIIGVTKKMLYNNENPYFDKNRHFKKYPLVIFCKILDNKALIIVIVYVFFVKQEKI